MVRAKLENFPIEIAPPDLSAWAEGDGAIPYMITRDSGRPGPHAMILGLTHGNELCGAVAIAELLDGGVTPARGRLTLGFGNIAAYRRFTPADPNASRFVDEDFNRVWDMAVLDGTRRSAELERARAIRPLIDTVDYLLDIHSMQYPTAPLMLAGMTRKSLDFARRLGAPAHIVRDAGHAAGRRLRDYAGFADPESPKTALLVECGQHWAAESVPVARMVARRFLAALAMAPPVDDEPPAPPQHVIEVTDAITIATDRFSFLRPHIGMEVIAKAGTLLGHDDGREIRTPYDDCVLIMPSRRLARGQTAVRLGRFVEAADV